jgi:hypothetical protein
LIIASFHERQLRKSMKRSLKRFHVLDSQA